MKGFAKIIPKICMASFEQQLRLKCRFRSPDNRAAGTVISYDIADIVLYTVIAIAYDKNKSFFFHIHLVFFEKRQPFSMYL